MKPSIRLLTLFSGSSPLNTLLGKFNGAGDEVAIMAETSGAGINYNLLQHIGSRKYWRLILNSPAALSAGNEWMSIFRSYISTLYAGYNDTTTPAITKNGSWTTDSSASYTGGRLMYSDSTGAYLQFVTPAGTENIGALGNPNAGNLGVALVSIDGDNTLATSLPTAQQLVDDGTLANTVLVANGGTLNPTDRVWNQYQQTWTEDSTHFQLFAENLEPASYTVRITVTGYKQAASSGVFVLLYLGLAYGSTLFNLTPTTYHNILIYGQSLVLPDNPRWEISYNTKPTGATATEWIGHTGSLKYITTPTVLVDGVLTTISSGDIFTGSEIVVQMQLGARHTEIGGGATDIGVLDLSFTIHKTTGLTITHSLAWSMGGVAVSFPCMMGLNHSVFDRFNSLGSALDATDLTDNDGSIHFNTKQQAIYSWDANGNVGALMYIPDLALTVENWAKAGDVRDLYWADVADATWKKAYANRFVSNETFTNATIWESECNYRVQWFTDGAANHLT